MAIRIDAWSDFTCPFCFKAAAALAQLGKDDPLEVHWRTLQLRPPGSPPLNMQAKSQLAVERERVIREVQEAFGIELHPAPVGLDTRLAHLATKYAQAHGQGAAFHAAVLNAYWVDCVAIDGKELLERLVSQVGLDGSDLAKRWDDPALVAAIDDDMNLARAHNISSIPTMLFDSKYLVSGGHPVAIFKQILDRVHSDAAGG
jgi:predicted DsbA family dithiol-disulfide isomerase